MIVTFAWIVAVVVIAWVAYWAIQTFPPPEPLHRVAYFAIGAIAVLVILGLVLGLFGVNLGLPKP